MAFSIASSFDLTWTIAFTGDQLLRFREVTENLPQICERVHSRCQHGRHRLNRPRVQADCLQVLLRQRAALQRNRPGHHRRGQSGRSFSNQHSTDSRDLKKDLGELVRWFVTLLMEPHLFGCADSLSPMPTGCPNSGLPGSSEASDGCSPRWRPASIASQSVNFYTSMTRSWPPTTSPDCCCGSL